MERDEIIKGLYQIKNWKCNGDAEMYEVIESAIKLLEQPVTTSDTVSRQSAMEACMKYNGHGSVWACIMEDIKMLPSAQPEQKWIPCSERLPEIGKPVLLSTTRGRTITGCMDEPATMYLVFDNNKDKEIWVYDPESYTDAFDFLPKAKDCSFSDSDLSNGSLSVTSLNYNPRYEGITAWTPLPEPYQGKEKGEDE